MSLSSMLYAAPVTWLERGNIVSADQTESSEQLKARADGTPIIAPLVVKLATGSDVTLIGDVYVESETPHVVLEWAAANALTAKASPWVPGAVSVTTTAEQSLEYAAIIAKLPGVTTAMPAYRQEMVLK